MSAKTSHHQGGDIQLDRNKPTGLPLRKPLYGLPPYQYTGDVVLMVVYEAEEAAIREVLPRELEPLPGKTVAMCFFLCPDVTGMGPHNFAMPCVPVRHGDFNGQFIPYLYTSTDASLACYRELQGWPAVMGETEISEDAGMVTARVLRNGREIIRAMAQVGGEIITTLDFLPVILYKEIPSFDGQTCGCDLLRGLDFAAYQPQFKAGSVELSFPNPGDDPIARLKAPEDHE